MAKPSARKPASSGRKRGPSAIFARNGGFIAMIIVFAGISIGYLLQNVDYERHLYGLVDFATDQPPPEYPRAIDQARNITYVGITNRKTGVEHFRNIFYAEDTSGPNRFAPPVPFLPARGSVINATAFGAWCPQRLGDAPLPFTSPITNISENCLSVQVSRPEGTDADAKLPVMVWLHGGGHALGSGSDVLYTPDGLVNFRGTPSVIFVAINYRFGIFGFAASKALLAAGHTNVGLKDQRAAFDWVKKNIAVFGGDPNRVTAIGQSVGASDIGLHITSYGGKKGVPFDRAIMLSGAPGQIFDGNRGTVAENTAAVAAAVGCVQKHDPQSVATLKCLRQTPFELLTNTSVSMASAAHPPFGEAFFFPTHDGNYIPDYPSKLMRTGKFVKDIPIFASWSTNDGAWYAPPTLSSDEELAGALKLWTPSLTNSTLTRLLDLYPLSDFERPQTRPVGDGPVPSAQYYRAAQIERDIWFTCPVLDFTWQYMRHARKIADASESRWAKIRGYHLTTDVPIWLHEFNATRFGPVYEYMGVPFWGVGHLSEIPYVLNIRDLPGGIDSSREQLQRADSVAYRILGFVQGEDNMEDWMPSFRDKRGQELENEHAGHLHIDAFGGPDYEWFTWFQDKDKSEWLAADREKLSAKCAFINSEQMRKDTGV